MDALYGDDVIRPSAPPAPLRRLNEGLCGTVRRAARRLRFARLAAYDCWVSWTSTFVKEKKLGSALVFNQRRKRQPITPSVTPLPAWRRAHSGRGEPDYRCCRRLCLQLGCRRVKCVLYHKMAQLESSLSGPAAASFRRRHADRTPYGPWSWTALLCCLRSKEQVEKDGGMEGSPQGDADSSCRLRIWLLVVKPSLAAQA